MLGLKKKIGCLPTLLPSRVHNISFANWDARIALPLFWKCFYYQFLDDMFLLLMFRFVSMWHVGVLSIWRFTQELSHRLSDKLFSVIFGLKRLRHHLCPSRNLRALNLVQWDVFIRNLLPYIPFQPSYLNSWLNISHLAICTISSEVPSPIFSLGFGKR